MRSLIKKIGLLLLWMSCAAVTTAAAERPLASLQSFTGLWNMPTARVLPDWDLRLGYGRAEPFRYYGGAIGLLDRLEFHGQFTEVSTLAGFADAPEYGYYKDRAAGARLVLWKEDEIFPQIAAGAFDATGTGIFVQRYLVASKRYGKFDFTLGAGQGVLAGEVSSIGGSLDVGAGQDPGLKFLFSGPGRTTKLFGGVEYDLTSNLTFSTEYSQINRRNLFGYSDKQGHIVKDPASRWPVNVGVKYHSENLQANLAVLRGNTLAAGVQFAFPMKLGSALGWKKTPRLTPGISLKYRARHADNEELAKIVAEELKKQGFADVGVVCGDSAIWVEFANNRHLEVARSFGHVADTIDTFAPPRIGTFYVNQTKHRQVVQSFKLPRESFRAFMEQRLEAEDFQYIADLSLSPMNNWRDFNHAGHVGRYQAATQDLFSYSIKPKVQTFLNNKEGFFKHRGVIGLSAGLKLWKGARIVVGSEFVLFNQFDELEWEALESDSVRTDSGDYQSRSDPRLTELAFEQYLTAAGQIQNRLSAGIFDRSFAGVGYENFRYFNDGLWGIGLESEFVRKRDVKDNFMLRDEPGMDKWFYTAFLNLYAQLWPEQGLEGGLKIGRFLAGDPGVRIDLRRSFKYFTVGAWYTKTDTDIFTNPKNKVAEGKGVYIRFPLAVFRDIDVPGFLRYAITSFTRDQGQLVSQPSSLYPMGPWDTPAHTKRELNKMRAY